MGKLTIAANFSINAIKTQMLHCVSNGFWTLYYPHKRRGIEAFEAMGVLPGFGGILCHDHWKPYYRLDCTHAL